MILVSAMHEKIFITFMVCSLCHMLATIKLNGVIHEDHTELSQKQRDSIKWKKILFAMSILSTIGLLIFFAKHRFYCHVLGKLHYIFFNLYIFYFEKEVYIILRGQIGITSKRRSQTQHRFVA